jgi:hypothetical protein
MQCRASHANTAWSQAALFLTWKLTAAAIGSSTFFINSVKPLLRRNRCW